MESFRRRRRRLIILMVIVGALVGCAPLLASVYLARQQAEQERFAALESIASSIGRQVLQYHKVLNLLEKHMAGQADPCSAANLDWMQKFQVNSWGVKSVVILRNGHVQCSTSGELLASMSFLRPDVEQPGGKHLFLNIRIPGLDEQRYLLFEHDGVGLLLNPDGVISPFTEQGMAIGIYTSMNGKFATKHGPLRNEWVTPMAPGVVSDQLLDHDSNYFVVRHHPADGVSDIVLGVPMAVVDARAAQLRHWLMPLAGLVSLLLLTGTYLLTRHRLSTRAELLRALHQSRFFLVYQPVMDLQSNTCIGAEALIRWRQEDGTTLPPDLFIPFAERSGLIHLVTRRVLELVRHDLTGFLQSYPEFRIGVNLSPSDLQSDRAVHDIADTIHAIGPGNGRFVVEVTEQGLLEEKSVLGVMEALHALNIEIAIDDFGTGYSGIAYLTTYPFDILKIDKVFITTASTDAVTSQVAMHIIEMGRTVGMKVLTEGIETQQQADLFRNLGVDYAQGYFFSKPLSAAELYRFVEQNTTPGQLDRKP